MAGDCVLMEAVEREVCDSERSADRVVECGVDERDSVLRSDASLVGMSAVRQV